MGPGARAARPLLKEAGGPRVRARAAAESWCVPVGSNQRRARARAPARAAWRGQRAGRPRSRAFGLALVALFSTSAAWAQDPFVDSVASFTPGTNAGFGAEQLPGIVLGPPRGAGAVQGSFDVVSLGNDGVIVVGFDQPVICDGPGVDFTVFENAFHSGSPSGPIFAEYGIVAVSQDGVNFIELPYDAVTHEGLAGQTPVFSHPDNGIDPLDPSVSGGDSFDLASTGLTWAAFVRITDPGAAIPDPGNMIPPGTSAGFDLDAVAALHACDPGQLPTATPTHTAEPGSPTQTATVTPAAVATATATIAVTSHDAAVVSRAAVKVRIANGSSTTSKRVRVKVRNQDTSGSIPIRLTVAGCGPVTATSVDFDRRSAGAQDTATIRAGRAKAAVVSLDLSAALVTTPDRDQPAHCLLTFTATVDVPGNSDPTPADNSLAVDLVVLDRNDVQ
jgi:hypothetical protein